MPGAMSTLVPLRDRAVALVRDCSICFAPERSKRVQSPWRKRDAELVPLEPREPRSPSSEAS